MIRVILIITCSILFGFNLNAQEESLSEKELIDIGYHYFAKANKAYNYNNLDSTLIYVDSALIFIRKTTDWDFLVKSMAAQSNVYSYKGDYLRSDSVLQETYSLAKEKIHPDSSTYGMILTSLGIQHLDIGDYNNAITKFERVLDIEKKIGNKLAIASVLNNLGDLYFDKGDYDEALNYYQESKKYRFEDNPNDWRVAKSYNHIGNAYRKKKQQKSRFKKL